MRALIVGSGSRREAIARRLVFEDSHTEIWCTPGVVQNTHPRIHSTPFQASAVHASADWATATRIDFVIFCSERELFAGVCDTLLSRGIACFGPTSAASRIEADKAYAKRILQSLQIPTPAFRRFSSASSALSSISELGFPCVAKFVGPARPSDVQLVKDLREAKDWLERLPKDLASKPVLFETAKFGNEYSVLGFTDGTNVVAWPTVVDYKKALDGNDGQNTGGMGAHAPATAFETANHVASEVLQPLVQDLAGRGTPYRGVLTANVIEDSDAKWVIDLNSHIGDPEMATLLQLYGGNLGELLSNAACGSLKGLTESWLAGSAVSITLASADYPLRGSCMGTIRVPERTTLDGVFYHDALQPSEEFFSGGRLICVSASDSELSRASELAYAKLEEVLRTFRLPDGSAVRFRHDIGRSNSLPME